MPTRLISPLNTFQNCGNSSMYSFRNMRPRGVTLRIVADFEHMSRHFVLLEQFILAFFSPYLHRAELINREETAVTSYSRLTKNHGTLGLPFDSARKNNVGHCAKEEPDGCADQIHQPFYGQRYSPGRNRLVR